MKVLFVSSGNSKAGISSLVFDQGESLRNEGLDVSYFTVKGRGWYNYLKHISILKKEIKNHKPDIIHAHNIFCGFVAALAGAKPLLVSLMGWNVKKKLLALLIRIFNRLFWDACIVKSISMKNDLGIDSILVIPNGVDLDMFHPMGKETAISRCQWDHTKRHVLFAADPSVKIKNYPLAKQAIDRVNDGTIDLHVLGSVDHSDMVFLYNAADVVLFTSFAEGSPNVIKEAMACNCIIVSTDVGDVKERFADAEGCYLCNNSIEDVAFKLQDALLFRGKPSTRNYVLDLDSRKTARTICSIYANIHMPGDKNSR